MKIAVLDIKSIGEGLDYSPLYEAGEVTLFDYTDQTQVLEHLKGVDVAVSNKVIYTKEIIKALPDLKLICMTGTGYNHIDVAAAKSSGVGVCNVIDYCTESVAQHTMAMVLHLVHQLSYYKNYVSEGRYIDDEDFTHYEVKFRELGAMRWGIVGMGNIGRRVAELANAFGCDVVYYSTSGRNNDQSYQQVDLDELIESCDIITVHSPMNERTSNLVDAKILDRMKRDVILVNAGRGGIINERDVVDAVLKGGIGGLGIDVLTKEPMSADSPYMEVRNHNNVLITPHVAWAAVEARQRVIHEVLENITTFVSGKRRNRVE